MSTPTIETTHPFSHLTDWVRYEAQKTSRLASHDCEAYIAKFNDICEGLGCPHFTSCLGTTIGRLKAEEDANLASIEAFRELMQEARGSVRA